MKTQSPQLAGRAALGRPAARAAARAKARPASARTRSTKMTKKTPKLPISVAASRPYSTLAGGLTNMRMMRALFLASLLGGLALAACGGAGSGGAAPTTTANPALGTNEPAASPMPSGDPYSDYGY